MGRLSAADATAFEDHYITCSLCAGVVEDTDRYVRTMATAARRLRGSTRQD
jgi:hypothetical protein